MVRPDTCVRFHKGRTTCLSGWTSQLFLQLISNNLLITTSVLSHQVLEPVVIPTQEIDISQQHDPGIERRSLKVKRNRDYEMFKISGKELVPQWSQSLVLTVGARQPVGTNPGVPIETGAVKSLKEKPGQGTCRNQATVDAPSLNGGLRACVLLGSTVQLGSVLI